MQNRDIYSAVLGGDGCRCGKKGLANLVTCDKRDVRLNEPATSAPVLNLEGKSRGYPPAAWLVISRRYDILFQTKICMMVGL